MNKLAFAGAALAVLGSAAVALAASPSSSTDPGAAPGTSAMPGASAASSPATRSSSSTGQSAAKSLPSWTAQVAPVDITGSATIDQKADGTGLLTLQLTGMVNEENWTVDFEPGAVQHPNDAVTIALKQGSDVEKVAPDKIQVHLTKAEMDAFTHALNSNPGGVTIFVSDGHRLSAATLTVTQQ